jgi:ArsR family transcriptional regulator, arsenate/arsenite/antimonite-responsive transcriptional repressor
LHPLESAALSRRTPNSAIDAAQRRLQTLYFEITRNIVDKLDPRPYFESHQNEGTARTVEKKAALDALSALSQETRLDLFRLLVTVGPQGLPAGVIAERLGVLPSSLTFHLNHLVRAGLITQRRLSRQLIYSAEYGTMNDLLAYLTENCCGRDVLANPACNPADAFNTGESDEAPARACQS